MNTFINKKKLETLKMQSGGDHYRKMRIQPIEYIQRNSIPWCEGNIIKYVSRHMNKNGIEDLKKAMHYLKVCAELEYKTII